MKNISVQHDTFIDTINVMMNADTIPVDWQQRKKAIQPELSFIVQAPAGSGKTELLIQRYLRLLALVEQPEQILAITFTRKAASEMQGRILKALQRAHNKMEPDREHQKLTYDLATEALERDRQLTWSLLENPSRLSIQTIDSFCSRLIRRMPILSQLGAYPEVSEDAEQGYRLAASRVLETVNSEQTGAEAVRQLLQHLDNDLPRVQRLIIKMLGQRDQWLRQIVGNLNRETLEAGFKRLLIHYLKQLHTLFPSDCIQELCSLAQYAAKTLIEQNQTSIIQSCIDMNELPGFNAEDREQWLGIRELLLRADGDWRVMHNKNQGFSPVEGNAEQKAHRKSMKQRAKQLIHQLQDIDGLNSALDIIRLLPQVKYSDDEWQIVQSLCQVLLLSAAQLQLIFSETGKMDFSSISSAAIQALGCEDDPSDLALHLDYQLDHILVDEFQDISYQQYLLLKGLTTAWDVSTNKSLFLVGDPMQSIYRFREAEVRLFIDAWQNQCLGAVPLQCLRLTVNFRSSNTIVQWINQQFTDIMPRYSEPEVSAVAFSSSVAFHAERHKTAISVFPQFDSDGDREAHQLSDMIQKIRTEYIDETIAVLVRNRSHLIALMRVLKNRGIRYHAVEIENLLTQGCIQDLMALTRAYLQRADRVAWLAVLRAPWCGLELASLLELAGTHRERTIWQCLQDETLLLKLSNEEYQRVKKIITVFQSCAHAGKRQSLRISIESIWIQLGGPASLHHARELENCLEFFQCIDELEEAGSINNAQSLLERIETLYAAADSCADDHLQLMTMHKSKGLEFDHVILPGLGRPPKNSDNPLLLWTLRLDGINEDLIMAPVYETGKKNNVIYDYLKLLEHKKESYEDSRLLYVACTRAKHCLYLSGHAIPIINENDRTVSFRVHSRSLLSRVWPSLEEHFTKSFESFQDNNETHTEMTINQSLRRFESDWKIPDTDSFTISIHNNANDRLSSDIEFDWASESIMHIGTVVHQNLQLISEQGVKYWSCDRIKQNKALYWKQLKVLGVNKQEKEYCCQQVMTALANTLRDPTGQWILSQAHQQIENELALTGFYENQLSHIRIDRTFVDVNDVRWIIDYKTSRHEQSDKQTFVDQQIERYQAQLNKYYTIFSAMERRKMKMGLYFPLLKAFREVSI